jgi:hypothetical protein
VGWAGDVEPVGAPTVEKGFVYRYRLDEGVAAAFRRTARPTSRYFAMSNRITTACGHAASALNIGIAERTP